MSQAFSSSGRFSDSRAANPSARVTLRALGAMRRSRALGACCDGVPVPTPFSAISR